MRIKAALFEDNPLLRESLFQLINSTDDIICTGAFPDCSNLMRKVESAKPDVILMDIDLPGMNGIEAVGLINQTHPEMVIIMQTVFNDHERIFQSITAGASGYLLKNTSPARILESIREAASGGAPMTPSIAHKILEVFRSKKPALPAKEQAQLNDRQKEILECIFNGMSYKLIGDKLFVSVDTVRYHVKNIYEILHVHSRDELISKVKGKSLLSF
ncbi:MAG: response regulator transcription factor [Saprospiraceae bacterium]|uniref:Response regulator transcription factor n=1 Tax=Candidatus Opimibacter skivensis TaxID=2982028 RepID=A0A9D7XRT2_9BACT|nr:response regulator transcription factor [Candidatus Opimibacter skivensis]